VDIPETPLGGVGTGTNCYLLPCQELRELSGTWAPMANSPRNGLLEKKEGRVVDRCPRRRTSSRKSSGSSVPRGKGAKRRDLQNARSSMEHSPVSILARRSYGISFDPRLALLVALAKCRYQAPENLQKNSFLGSTVLPLFFRPLQAPGSTGTWTSHWGPFAACAMVRAGHRTMPCFQDHGERDTHEHPR
jgi:hypothetical protein